MLKLFLRPQYCIGVYVNFYFYHIFLYKFKNFKYYTKILSVWIPECFGVPLHFAPKECASVTFTDGISAKSTQWMTSDILIEYTCSFDLLDLLKVSPLLCLDHILKPLLQAKIIKKLI